jgi:hypothetical protein
MAILRKFRMLNTKITAQGKIERPEKEGGVMRCEEENAKLRSESDHVVHPGLSGREVNL